MRTGRQALHSFAPEMVSGFVKMKVCFNYGCTVFGATRKKEFDARQPVKGEA